MTIYHFVGIKGSGMSALAQILHDMNFQVQGSDVEKHFFTQLALEQSGIKILPFQKENIKPGMTIIAGNAFPDTHEEIQEAMKLGLPIVRYHRFLGDFMKTFFKCCGYRCTWENIYNWIACPCMEGCKTYFVFNW